MNDKEIGNLQGFDHDEVTKPIWKNKEETIINKDTYQTLKDLRVDQPQGLDNEW